MARHTPGSPKRAVKEKIRVPSAYTIGFRKGMKSVAQKKKVKK